MIFYYMDKPHFFIHSSVHGHLGCVYLLTIVHSSAVNIEVQISLQYPDFSSFGHIPRIEIPGSYGKIFNFLRNQNTLFHSGCAILHSTVHKGSNFSTSSPTYIHTFIYLFIYLFIYDSGHPNGCEAISHCDCDLHFSAD